MRCGTPVNEIICVAARLNSNTCSLKAVTLVELSTATTCTTTDSVILTGAEYNTQLLNTRLANSVATQAQSTANTVSATLATMPTGTSTTGIPTTIYAPLPTLDPVDVSKVFFIGFSTVLTCFLIARGAGAILNLIRKG